MVNLPNDCANYYLHSWSWHKFNKQARVYKDRLYFVNDENSTCCLDLNNFADIFTAEGRARRISLTNREPNNPETKQG